MARTAHNGCATAPHVGGTYAPCQGTVVAWAYYQLGRARHAPPLPVCTHHAYQARAAGVRVLVPQPA